MGLLILVARDLGLQWTDRRGYARNPDGSQLVAALDSVADRCDGPAPGRIVAFEYVEDMPQHVGILTDHPSGLGLIHTWAKVGRVVEHGYDADIAGRAVGYWAWRKSQ